ncbi:hypothetical protein [Cytophaga sp. FL35]|uniref:tetratricopeptide repeat protein n=1 Tax=Cytophaga sp. FL35 TaxID=1904456 RepID=UPI001653B4E4|nr:hypothetical protein [Cytophaga sp. FL35]MBC6999901.1 hypothetical protein [Cytophaga sp. FL35]
MKVACLFTIVFLFTLSACKSEKQPKKELSQKAPIGCKPLTTDADWYKTNQKAPIIDGLNVLHFPTSTKDSLAQVYFNQGLVLAYGFNHAEAARSFYYATKLDPQFAMGYWGYAYVLGPNYNAGMEADNYLRAFDAVNQAKNLASTITEKERGLINALAKRYSKEPPEDRSNLDRAYSEALRKLLKQFPDDANIQSLYAESIMDQHPWDLWESNGDPKVWTSEIISHLNSALKINPDHPGAHHFYIHAVEASKNPEKALSSAQAFDDDLVPGAGHLVHMPSHIYIRTGDYHKGTLSNLRAVKVDSSYVSACNAQGAYPLALYPHNYHFMAATATLEGNKKIALKAANKVASQANLQLMKEPGWSTIQHFYTIPYHINVKFAEWEAILKIPDLDPSLKYPAAIRNYARGMAFIGLHDLEKAKLELDKLKSLAIDPELKEVTIWDINSVDVLVQIAERILEAEIWAKELNFERSIELLSEAVALEDQLNYNEPPDWFFSVRHHLGAVQLEGKKYEDAIATYMEDLKKFPKNGWALHGLQTAYKALQFEKEIQETNNLLKQIWATADIELSSSRIW